MKRGRYICNTLKAIRKKIAEANEINYSPHDCTHEGDCAGTCPACESEVRYLESELRKRRALGRAAVVAGVGMSLAALTACHSGNERNSASSAQQSVSKAVVESSGTDAAGYMSCDIDTPDTPAQKAKIAERDAEKRIPKRTEGMVPAKKPEKEELMGDVPADTSTMN